MELGAAAAAVAVSALRLGRGLSLPESALVSLADRPWTALPKVLAKRASRGWLWTVVLRAWMTVGRSDVALRLLPVLLAAVAAALVARSASAAGGRLAGAVAAGAFVFDGAVLSSWDLTVRSLVLPLAAGSCAAAVALGSRVTIGPAVLWSALATAVVAVEPAAAVLVAVQAAVIAVASLRRRGPLRLAAVAVAGLGAAPAAFGLVVVAWCIRRWPQPDLLASPGLGRAGEGGERSVGPSLGQLGLEAGVAARAAVAVALVLLGVVAWRARGVAAEVWAWFLVAGGSIAGVLALAVAVPGGGTRDVRWCVPPLAVGFGLAAASTLRALRTVLHARGAVASRRRTQWALPVGLAMMLACALPATWSAIRAQAASPSWEELTAAVLRDATPDAGIVFVPEAARLAFERSATKAPEGRRPVPTLPLAPWGTFDVTSLGAEDVALHLVVERASVSRTQLWVITDAATDPDAVRTSLGLAEPPELELRTAAGTARRYALRADG